MTPPSRAGRTHQYQIRGGVALTGWRAGIGTASTFTGAPAYIGNGYVGTRAPADGAGYGGTQPQGSVNLPGRTQLEVTVAGRRYAAADASSHRQTLDLRRGVVTTTATWSAGGRVTRLAYDVTLGRARERVGLVRLRLTPSWSGSLRVRDVLGAGDAAGAARRAARRAPSPGAS